MPRSMMLPLAVVLAIVVPAPVAAAAEPARTKVRPREIADLLANPGMGWQTFHRFADTDKQLQGLPSGSAYFRFYWREVEPEPGRPAFELFDRLLAQARRAGQKLAFRVMVTGSGEYADAPAWLRAAGCKGVEYEVGGRKHWVPDLADPTFQRAHFALIRALGKRYASHPDLDLVDIGSVGLWGEWHMSGTKDLATGKPVPLPPVEVQNAIIDEWRRAFPTTPKVVLIGSDTGMSRAARDGLGWRADCLGDMGGFSKRWNHMEHFYRQQLKKTKAEAVWQTAPVAFESCWDMRKWQQEGWDLRAIFDYGLDLHASYLNNKSAPLPPGSRAEVERFLGKLGYRLVLRGVEHDAVATAGQPVQVRLDWANVGVAPPYRGDRIALRLRSTADPQAPPLTLVSDTPVRGWLPGERTIDLALTIPADTAAGAYELAVGIVAAGTTTPAVRLAIAGRDATGWYPLSRIQVKRP